MAGSSFSIRRVPALSLSLVEVSKSASQWLKREVWEESGIDNEVVSLAFFSEEFYYYEPLDEAFHSFRFFYTCHPITLEPCSDEQVDDGEAEKPRWVDVDGLMPADFQNNGPQILNALIRRKHLTNSP